jgi:hypothetical protein
LALADQLVSFWELGEASGTRADSHGTNHLTDNNTVGQVGDAADFESGNSEYLDHADNADLSTGDIDFALAAWVNLEDDTAFRTIIDREGAGPVGEYNLAYHSAGDGSFRFTVYNSNASLDDSVVAAIIPLTATWYFIVAWHDTTLDKIFISVNAQGTPDEAPRTVTISNTAAPFSLGAYQYGGTPGGFFDGLMKRVGFWKRVLTAEEITWLYNGGAGRSYAEVLAGMGSNTPKKVIQAYMRAQ